MFKLLTVATMLFSAITYASEIKEIDSVGNIVEVVTNKTLVKEETSLSALERLKIKTNEKRRLRTISSRRVDNGEMNISFFYIKNTTYKDLTKGMLREAVFYLDYIIKNNNNIKKLELEAENLSLNAQCLAYYLNQDEYSVVFETLVSLRLDNDESTQEKLNIANQNLNKIFSNKKPTKKEEIEIRCVSVYEK